MRANESTVVGSLKTIATQEAIFRQQAEVDQNGNGIGEYGLLGELAGELAMRVKTGDSSIRIANLAYISQQLRTGGRAGEGIAEKSGYLFKIYLSNATPDNYRAAGDDHDLGGTPAEAGAAAHAAAMPLQESTFALYAWPAEIHKTGNRAFFVNEVGEVYATKMEQRTYSGTSAVPAADAAYVGTVFRSKIPGDRAPGNDGNYWYPTGN
jgi:hypothetical protein